MQEQRLHRQKQIEFEKERPLLLEKHVQQINSKVYINCGGYSNIQSYYDNVEDDIGLLLNNSIDNSSTGNNVVVSKSDDHSVTIKIFKNIPQMSNLTDISGKFKIPATTKNITTNPIIKTTLDANVPQLLKKARGRPRKKQPDVSDDVASTSGCVVTSQQKRNLQLSRHQPKVIIKSNQ